MSSGSRRRTFWKLTERVYIVIRLMVVVKRLSAVNGVLKNEKTDAFKAGLAALTGML